MIQYPTSPVAIYHIGTGEIVSTGGIQFLDEFKEQQVSAAVAPWGAADHALIEAEAMTNSHYVITLDGSPILADRPPIPYRIDKAAVVVGTEDFATISGLHDPCEVVIDDPDPLVETMTVTVTGGSFEFSAETVGIYTIQIKKFPFLDLSLEIAVVNPQADVTAGFSTDFSYEFGI